MKISEIDINNITDELIKKVLFNVPVSSFESVDVMIIFGCHVKELLDERLKCAIEIIKQHQVETIIISGGVGEKGDFNESKYMLASLNEAGITKNIIIEDESTTSEKNVYNCVQILKNNNWVDKTCLLVSNEFHLRKLSMLFKHSLGDIKLLYAYPSESLFSYDNVTTHDTLRNIAISQVVKIKGYVASGLVPDENIDAFINLGGRNI